MSLLLLVLGLLLAAAGAAAMGFGIPINELALGSTLITAGTTALVGGLLLVGLSAAVAELSGIVKNLKAGPVVRPARATAEPAVAAATVAAEPLLAREPVPLEPITAEPRIAPEARPAAEPSAATATPPAQVSASAIERLRSSIPRAERSVPVTEGVPLSPNGQQQQHAEQPVEPPLRPAGADVTQAAREPRLDFLFRSRQGTRASPPQQQEAFDAMWPKRPGREPQLDAERKFEPRVEPKLEPAPGVEEGHAGPSATVVDEPAVAESVQYAPPPPTPAPPPTAETTQRTVAILKSGVVDGMAYTLYADGSIEAQLPQGTVRFGSISELRAHIENNS